MIWRCPRLSRFFTMSRARYGLSLLVLSSAFGQIICAVTPDSMASVRAGSLAATEIGKWRENCYLPADSPHASSFTQEEFAIRFIKLHQLDAGDVADIFNVKQSMTKWAKVAKVCEVLGAAGLAATGIGGVRIGVQAALGIGVFTYTATKAGEYATRQIPPTTNALSGMCGPGVVMLQPGQGYNCKLYASKMKGATEMGPVVLGQSLAVKTSAALDSAYQAVPFRYSRPQFMALLGGIALI